MDVNEVGGSWHHKDTISSHLVDKERVRLYLLAPYGLRGCNAPDSFVDFGAV